MGNSKIKTSIEEPSLKFDDLWKNYPSKVEHLDKNKKDIYDNHCAIKVSDALEKSGIKLKKYKGSTCDNDGNNKKHALKAEDLANWLKKQKIKGLGDPEVYDGSNYLDKIKGRTGIVYFEDYWPRPGESRDHGPRTGDHIDLWKKGKSRKRLVSFVMG